MTHEQVIFEVLEAFAHVQRPTLFIRETCACDECLEHEAEMQSFVPDNLPLDKLDNPGWDPICFASNAAFAYLMPGLVKLVLAKTDDYVQQFLFHVEQPDRVAAFTPMQSRALTHVLDFLLLHQADALEDNFLVDELYRTREKLEQGAAGDDRAT